MTGYGPEGDAAFIPQSEPWYGWQEAEAVTALFESGSFLTEHTKTREFERAFAEYVGSKHAIAAPNGTLSLTMAALALGLGPGDEAIVPAYSMLASASAFSLIGIKPVFVDVEPETLCLDTKALATAVTNRTKAIVLVTANGRVPHWPIEKPEAFCAFTGLHLIEDAAQSLGSRYPDGRHCGRAGVVGSFSLSAPKIISTGQGGMLVTDDDALASRLRLLKDFGRTGGGNDVHGVLGWNFKLTDVQSTIGLEQMKKLPWRVERKKKIWSRYCEGIGGHPAQVQMFPMRHTTPWFIDILADRRDELASFLRSRGIGTRPMYTPIPHQACYNLGGSYPVAEDVGRRGLWLPSSSQLTDEDIARVCGEIRAFYEGG